MNHFATNFSSLAQLGVAPIILETHSSPVFKKLLVVVKQIQQLLTSRLA
jgi:hypothetical protein